MLVKRDFENLYVAISYKYDLQISGVPANIIRVKSKVVNNDSEITLNYAYFP